MYETESAIRLEGDPRILKSGMQKNVRFVGDNAQNAHPILQIDRKFIGQLFKFTSHFLAKKSAFYPGVTLLEYICTLLNIQNPRQLAAQIDRYRDQANRQIRGGPMGF